MFTLYFATTGMKPIETIVVLILGYIDKIKLNLGKKGKKLLCADMQRVDYQLKVAFLSYFT